MPLDIQPIWPIEEYAKIGRSWVWFKPIRPPKSALAPEIYATGSIILFDKEDNIRIIGEIFWIVDNTQHIFHLILFITIGNQKWHGAIPSFIRILIRRNIGPTPKRWEVSALINNSPEASAWNRKYLMAASFSWLDLEVKRSGTKEYILSSRPAQIVIQLLDDKTTTTPNKRVKEKRV